MKSFHGQRGRLAAMRKQWVRRVWRGAMHWRWFVAAALAPLARAGLPELADPELADDDNLFEILQEVALNLVLLGGLLLSAGAFLVVAKNAVSKYSEVADGRSSWGDLAMHVGVGIGLLVAVIFLLTQTPDILSDFS